MLGRRCGTCAVGLAVIAAMAGLLALMSVASDGPGFLAPQKTIDVVFRDGQGIRVGSPVRVAGLDAGNVVDLDLVEVEGTLWPGSGSRCRPAAREAAAGREGQHQPGLTGMSHVNIVATGQSAVALVPGQWIPGVESSFFDPIIEQVGLGPVERSHLSHTIAEVRQTVDTVGPQAPADADGLPGDLGQPQGHERRHPARRRVDRRPRRGPVAADQRQRPEDRGHAGPARGRSRGRPS